MKKTTILEVNQIHTNNTHRIILKKSVPGNTSRKTSNLLIFDDANLRGGFAQVPNIVLYDPLLAPPAKLCYALLLSYAWTAEHCFPSQKLLAENMACSVRTTIKALQALQKHKLITIERLGQGKPNIYHIRKFTDGYLPEQFID